MHDEDKRKKLKQHSPCLWEVADYKDICLFDQAGVSRKEILVMSGLIALSVFLFPNAKGNKDPTTNRIELLCQIHRPFHEPGSVLEKSIKLFSSLKKHFECGFTTSSNYQEFFGTSRSKGVEQIKVKALFHLEYKPVEGNEEKAIELLKDSLKGKLTGTIKKLTGFGRK
jgi:hypothetical protein